MKSRETLVQVGLSCEATKFAERKRHLVCLVEDRPDVKVGNMIVLKDDDTHWYIEWVSQPISRGSVHRTWNNNI